MLLVRTFKHNVINLREKIRQYAMYVWAAGQGRQRNALGTARTRGIEEVRTNCQRSCGNRAAAGPERRRGPPVNSPAATTPCLPFKSNVISRRSHPAPAL